MDVTLSPSSLPPSPPPTPPSSSSKASVGVATKLLAGCTLSGAPPPGLAFEWGVPHAATVTGIDEHTQQVTVLDSYGISGERRAEMVVMDWARFDGAWRGSCDHDADEEERAEVGEWMQPRPAGHNAQALDNANVL